MKRTRPGEIHADKEADGSISPSDNKIEIEPAQKRVRRENEKDSNNEVANPSTSESKMEKLIQLLSFWLSGSNLSKDRFLLGALTSTGVEGDGWTEAKMFVSFNKARELDANVSDVITVLKALKKPLIELNDDETMFRFKGGMEALRAHVACSLSDADKRTLFLTSFPSREKVSRDDVISMFQRFGEVQYVSMPRSSSKGSCTGFAFVEMGQSPDVENALRNWRSIIDNHSKSDELVGKFQNVNVFPFREWVRRKKSRTKRKREREEIAPREDGQAHNKKDNRALVEDPNPGECENGGGEVNGKMDVEESTRTDNEPDDIAKDSEVQENTNKSANDESKIALDYEPGVVVFVSGLCNRNEKAKRRRDLYDAFETHGPVSFVEYKTNVKDRDVCYARFAHSSGASRAVSDLTSNGLLAIPASRLRVSVLSGSEERKYWERVQVGRQKKSERFARKHKR